MHAYPGMRVKANSESVSETFINGFKMSSSHSVSSEYDNKQIPGFNRDSPYQLGSHLKAVQTPDPGFENINFKREQLKNEQKMQQTLSQETSSRSLTLGLALAPPRREERLFSTSDKSMISYGPPLSQISADMRRQSRVDPRAINPQVYDAFSISSSNNYARAQDHVPFNGSPGSAMNHAFYSPGYGYPSYPSQMSQNTPEAQRPVGYSYFKMHDSPSTVRFFPQTGIVVAPTNMPARSNFYADSK